MSSIADQVAIESMSIGDYEEVLGLWQGTEGVGLNETDSKARIEAYLKRNPGLSLSDLCVMQKLLT